MNLAAHPSALTAATDLNLDPYWMPFTHNRYFKKHNPLDRLLVGAEGAYYTTVEGKKLFDCLSGLWCSSLGHRPAKEDARPLGLGHQVQFIDRATVCAQVAACECRVAVALSERRLDG